MREILAQFGDQTHLPISTIAFRMFLATLFGAVIGIEREWRQRPAGLRTHILIALAACVFTILTGEIVQSQYLQEPNARADPVRVVEAVTAGVAFLAAGAIIQGRRGVSGLTTGAGMWLAGSLGVAAGLGYFVIGAIAAAFGMVVIFLLKRLEVVIGPGGK
jgi:putative Mg2+ transporter-C (MgtC) family protein